MKKTLAFAAVLATSGLAFGAGTDIVVDISGVESWDAEGDASNTILSIDVAAAMGLPSGTAVIMNGIGWDVHLETVGASWLSEQVMAMGPTGGPAGLYLTPSATGAPGVESNFSDVLKLEDLGIPTMELADGMLHVEFFESFVDVEDAVDSFYLDGSTITIQATEVPAPAALALLGVAGIAGNRRRRG